MGFLRKDTWYGQRKGFPAFLTLLLVSVFLAGPGPGARPGEGASQPRPTATFPDGHLFQLEIADTPERRAMGYMFRERVGPGDGMLFLFPRDDFHSFWMKNCLVSLDLIWLSSDLRVTHLEKQVPPCRHDPCPSYAPIRKGRYVLEVMGGMAEKTRLRVGDPVRVEGIDLSLFAPP